MERNKPLPIPQKEFGFARDTFNLVIEFTCDGERLAREQERAEEARQRAEKAQPRLFPVSE